MNRIYLKLFLSMIVASSIISSCKEDGGVPYTFTSQIDLKGSSVSADQYKSSLMYSIDNGTTFSQYPILKEGQQYMVKITTPGGGDLTAANCFDVDWSASNPKPTSVTGGIATFATGSANNVSAIVTNIPTVAAEIAGTYTVVQDDWEDFAPGDELTVETIDATHIKIVEYPGTAEEHSPLVVTITDLSIGAAVVESQYSGSYGGAANKVTTSGTGSVSCNGTINLTLSFKFPSTTYSGNHLILTKN